MFEQKLQKKKDKIKEMIFDFQEKESEMERMNLEVQSFKEKIKLLNTKIK